MKTHIQVVAILHMAFGAMSLLAALILCAIFGLAGGIVISQGQHDVAGILSIVGIALCGLLTLLALPGIIGGWALYTGRSWGRPLVLVLGILDFLNVPIGTALGIYTLWALTRDPQTQAA